MPLFEETIESKLNKLKTLLKNKLESHKPSYDEDGDEIDSNVPTLGLCMLLDAILENNEDREKQALDILFH